MVVTDDIGNLFVEVWMELFLSSDGKISKYLRVNDVVKTQRQNKTNSGSVDSLITTLQHVKIGKEVVTATIRMWFNCRSTALQPFGDQRALRPGCCAVA